MFAPRPPRDRERGNSLLLALIVMSALATLGSLTVVSTQSSLKTSTNHRAQTIAMYAAESGAAATMVFLRAHFDPATTNPYSDWSAYLAHRNQNVQKMTAADIPGASIPPDTTGNLFTSDQQAWYEIELYNNRNDPLFSAPTGQCDGDGRLIIRATGHGPQGAVAIVEWEIQRLDYTRGWPVTSSGPPVVYGPPSPQPPLFPGWNSFADPTATPPTFTPSDGMVLVGWHIVSL
jgi:hypothetical protein